MATVDIRTLEYMSQFLDRCGPNDFVVVYGEEKGRAIWESFQDKDYDFFLLWRMMAVGEKFALIGHVERFIEAYGPFKSWGGVK